MTRANWALSFLWWTGPLLQIACGSGTTQIQPANVPSTGEAFGGKNCLAIRNPTEPSLTAWEADERAQLTALRHQGVVAVRYSVRGCNVDLEVLPNCIGGGSYEFTPSPSTKQDYITDERALFAELPLGAAGLSGQLRGHRVLRTDYTLVGIASLPPGHAYAASELHGPDCARATHVVARFYLGGFAMAAGEEQSMRATATLFGASAGGNADARVARLFSEGAPSACSKAAEGGKEEPLCSVPLRLGLLALTPAEKALASANVSCSAGSHFESGSGCVPNNVAASAALEPGTAVAPTEASLAAQREFSALDQEIATTFDYEAGFHHYQGTSVEVVAAYQNDADHAVTLYRKLQRIVDVYQSPEWATAAIARQGSLYDSLRSGLYNTRAPQLQIFDPQTEAILRKAEASDNPDLQEKARALREKVFNAWRDRRDQELNSADQIMIDRYGNAFVLARRYGVSGAGVARATRRLAFFADALGEPKMRSYTANVRDLGYTDGMFQRLQAH
jgi:hypothetical protein